MFNVVPSSDPREAGFTYRAADRALAEATSSYWVNFVKTGDPNGKGLPQCPAYNATAEPFLECGGKITTGTHLLKAERDLQERAQSRPR